MLFRFFGSFTSLTLCAITVVAQSGDPQAQKPVETAKTVHQMFVEDQDDGRTIKDEATNQQYLGRVKAREAVLRTMLAAGEIKTGDDFRDVAFIFQHGDTPDEFLFAHILAMEALARGATSARFIAAATLDRYLQFTKQPQVFGTQYVTDHSVPLTGKRSALPLPFGRTLEPYHEGFLSDPVRVDFCVPALAEQKEIIDLFNHGEWPRDKMHPACN